MSGCRGCVDHACCYCAVMLCCRWQHQASDNSTKAISCPTVDAAATAAAAVISSCTPAHHDPTSTAHPASATAAAAASAAAASADNVASLLGQQPVEAAAAGPALTALLSILKWADGLCAVAGPAASGHGKRASSDGQGLGVPSLSFNVVLDERQHGTQSLLHSGLSRLQGTV